MKMKGVNRRKPLAPPEQGSAPSTGHLLGQGAKQSLKGKGDSEEMREWQNLVCVSELSSSPEKETP